jgi:CDP-diacylglycerol--serine O-phosphatidyltransferase
VQTGAPGSKAFKGMPIPAAATILASIIIFCEDKDIYEIWQGPPEKNFIFPFIVIVLSLLMVSTLKYHGLKEIDFKEKKPFWFLVVFVLMLFFLLIHSSTAMFVFAMTYLFWGIIENIILVIRKYRVRQPDQAGEREVSDEKNKNI